MRPQKQQCIIKYIRFTIQTIKYVQFWVPLSSTIKRKSKIQSYFKSHFSLIFLQFDLHFNSDITIYIALNNLFIFQAYPIYSNLHIIIIGQASITHSTMFLLLPCAPIKDQVTIPSVGEATAIAADLNKSRRILKDYSNIEFLLQRIRQGEVIMTRKVQFDNYIKAQVTLMRGCVSIGFPCPFLYGSYLGSQKDVSTVGLNTKQQWAIQMIMSRYTINSIYHAAAFSSLEFIFNQTSNSYEKGFKNTTKLITSLQITYKYFNEGYQPLKRLAEVFSTLQELFSKQKKDFIGNIVQTRKEFFTSVQNLVACNLGYLKLEKYRLMSENKSCKELAFAIYNVIKDTRTILNKSNLLQQIHPDMKVYILVGELFFCAYSYYFLLEEHEEAKKKQQYGFIKKQFQQMILENCIICEQFIKIAQKIEKFPGKENLDNVIFADNLIQTMLKEVKRKQYAYGINIHQNKEIKTPSIQQITGRRIGVRNLWDSIIQF